MARAKTENVWRRKGGKGKTCIIRKYPLKQGCLITGHYEKRLKARVPMAEERL